MMICKPCRKAGESNAQANRIDDLFGDTDIAHFAEMSRNAAREFHSECTGCDCQHRIGKLNVPPKAEPPTEVETESVSDSG